MRPLVYFFEFPDGTTDSLSIQAKAEEAPLASLPPWTGLGFHQCPNCPLSPDTTPHCPMAAQLVKLVSIFDKRHSYDAITVHVESDERQVTKSTTVQRAVGSVMGLLAATSDCPHVAFLKPMAHFHLPFSTEEETLYRVASMYLLAQYFLRQKNQAPDWDLAVLKDHYQALQQVNGAMAMRLRAISDGDGAVNAVILLDLLAKALPYSISETLEEMRPIFEEYWPPDKL